MGFLDGEVFKEMFSLGRFEGVMMVGIRLMLQQRPRFVKVFGILNRGLCWGDILIRGLWISGVSRVAWHIGEQNRLDRDSKGRGVGNYGDKGTGIDGLGRDFLLKSFV